MPGSSPLARGLRTTPASQVVAFRIIPARAGFTCRARRGSRTPADHPRSRGVYTTQPCGVPRRYGSSPLARGLHDSAMRRAAAIRIIPARAGFTCSMTRVTCIIADHPRSRGVYALEEDLALCDLGSSPLARGLHGLTYLEVLERRIIPARAGFTVRSVSLGGVFRIIPARAGFTWSA